MLEEEDRRFDYLFEPVAREAANDATQDSAGDIGPSSVERRAMSPRIVVLAVLAVIGVGAAAAWLVLNPADHGGPHDSPPAPASSTPQTTPATSAELPGSPPAPTSTVSEPSPTTEVVAPPPSAPPPAVTTAGIPANTRVPPTPATRSPISVQPQPRPSSSLDPSHGNKPPGGGLPGPLANHIGSQP